jgi:uncharacterized protein (DUF1778 family)
MTTDLLDVERTWQYYCHVRRTESIRLLVTAEEKARIEQAAAAARRSMSDWLRVVAEEEIERQLRAEGGVRESAG